MRRLLTLAASAAALVSFASDANAQTWGGPAAVLRDETLANSVLLWAPGLGEIEWSPADGIAGMPILLKDNIETRDMPTTAGSLALQNNAPGRDAPLVARLREAGAVILGKTAVPEMMLWPFTETVSFGATYNPWDTSYTPGGSSGGSGGEGTAGTGAGGSRNVPVFPSSTGLGGGAGGGVVRCQTTASPLAGVPDSMSAVR
jgi:amidase